MTKPTTPSNERPLTAQDQEWVIKTCAEIKARVNARRDPTTGKLPFSHETPRSR